MHTNESAIDMQKYRKSIFTILNILRIFAISYVPILCCVLVFDIFKQDTEGISANAACSVCAAVVFSSSFFNPFLYYWRVKEIRDSVRSIIRKLFCRQDAGQS